MTFNPIIAIPIYNQPHRLSGIVEYCLQHRWSVLLVNDGSNDETRRVIEALIIRHPELHLQTHEHNGGKGAAVITAFRWAHKQGYSHVMQLDADGQQNIERVERFLSLAKKQPDAFVCGYPKYDQTVPSTRKWGRKLTNFWVAVNTVSLAFKDTMCGFRVYPTQPCYEIVDNTPTIGTRMEFDSEIAVRLHWAGIKTVNAEVEVTYPKDGISHFRAIENWYLTKMHTRCFFGMLIRLPKLIAFKFQ